MERVVLQVDGMSCAHCLNAVHRALSAVAGVDIRSVQIGRAEVDLAEGTSPATLVAAIDDAGYRATVVPGA